jgi:protein-S-isoprenylcysteine O-methyltransferase Ste14
MDFVLIALQLLFIAPMAIRILTRERPQTMIGGELAASMRTPGLLVHEIGLALVWIGYDIGWWRDTVPRAITWPGAIGALLLTTATILMFWSFAALRSWRLLPTIDHGHELCTKGPYRFVRHPIYLAFDLLGIGLAIAVPNAMVIAGAILLIVGGHMRARAEEHALMDAFGARYEDYCTRVARRIPGLY